MKKRLFALLIVAFGSVSGYANEIDQLMTNQEVNAFMVKRGGKYFKTYPLLTNDSINNGSVNNTFRKLDLDGNGLTDLLIEGAYLVVLLDIGAKKYKLEYIDQGAFMLNRYQVQSVDTSHNPSLLIVKQASTIARMDTLHIVDTLQFLKGDLVEYHSGSSKSYQIDKIVMETSGCYGECPIFRLQIDKERNAQYHAIEFNDKEGLFSTIIQQSIYQELLNLLNHIRFDELKDRYKVNWTDDQTCTLTIFYNGNKVKNIEDYGMIGTFGLSSLYKKLSNLRKSQNWN